LGDVSHSPSDWSNHQVVYNLQYVKHAHTEGICDVAYIMCIGTHVFCAM